MAKMWGYGAVVGTARFETALHVIAALIRAVEPQRVDETIWVTVRILVEMIASAYPHRITLGVPPPIRVVPAIAVGEENL